MLSSGMDESEEDELMGIGFGEHEPLRLLQLEAPSNSFSLEGILEAIAWVYSVVNKRRRLKMILECQARM